MATNLTQWPLRISAAIALCSYSIWAVAQVDCVGKVKHLLIYADGTVNVMNSFRNDFTVVCNLNSTYAAVSPTVCASWVALLAHIKKKDGSAVHYYPSGTVCNAVPTYGDSPVPGYIGDLTP